MDAPDVPPQYSPIVIAQAEQAQSQAPAVAAKLERTIGVCQLIENPAIPVGTAFNTMSPAGSAWSYLREVAKLGADEVTDEMFMSAKVSLLQEAVHGTVKEEWDQNYRYIPTPNYLGTDRATFLVEMGNYRISVVYHFKVGGGSVQQRAMTPTRTRKIARTEDSGIFPPPAMPTATLLLRLLNTNHPPPAPLAQQS